MATKFVGNDAATKIDEMISILASRFSWDSTKEGYDFWSNVSQCLGRLRNEAISQGHIGSLNNSFISAYGNLIHIFDKGKVLCNFSKSKPHEWPKGHERVTIAEVDKATCTSCRASFLGPKK